MLARIAQRDRRSYLDANVAAAEAQFQAAYLDDLKAQDVALRQLQRITLAELDEALAEQRTLVERLTEEALRELEARRAVIAQTRKEWRESSVPLDDVVQFVPAVVEPYEGVTYLASEHHPRRYRTLGQTTTAYCSWYGNEFHGRLTACGQVYNQNDFTCASRTLPFGTRLALTRGDRRIIVVVTDRGPFIAGRDLDLSRAAARALGFSGLATVEVEFVEAIAE
ncbi:MAG: septal ring lytic transglycosylase RlpA family protein [Coriobacteriia bacterium]|nr:septal ring lytic transglycosylase RlpA family protein [Coriobacteriia bacterium]